MSYVFPTREAAELAAFASNAVSQRERNGKDVYHAALHDVVNGVWGVLRYRKYEDQPMLGWINRGFVRYVDGREMI